MNKAFRKIEIFIIVVIIAFIGIIYAFKQSRTTVKLAEQTPQTQTGLNPAAAADRALQQQNITTTIEYPGQDGKNALELLKASHQVEAKHYSFGDMVTSIDGITPDANHFWGMYVNGQFSQVGASAYTTKSTDQIKWQVDAVANNK